MCGLGKCNICGDISYECSVGMPNPCCGCFNDFKGIFKDIKWYRIPIFLYKLRKSKKWKFIKKHRIL
jgi:hypothetical protein